MPPSLPFTPFPFPPGNFVVLQLGIWLWTVLWAPVVWWLNSSGAVSNALQPGLNLALLSGALHAIYFWVLAQSYSIGDVSVVYPVGRGSAVAFTALLDTLVLAPMLGQPPISAQGWAGIAGVVLGVMLVGVRLNPHVLLWRNGSVVVEVPEASPLSPPPPQAKVLQWALGMGLLIALYTVVDVLGLRHWDTITFLWVNYGSAVLITLPLLSRQKEEAVLAWSTHRTYVVLIGLASPGTHLVVLWALSGGQTAYVVAVREVAIVVAALLGFLFLKEDVTPQKLLGIAILIAAIVIIKLA